MVHTCVLGPLQDGGDLVALLGLADAVARGGAHAHHVHVGLHPTQVGCGRGCTVWDLEVYAVGLHTQTLTVRNNIVTVWPHTPKGLCQG